MVHLCSSDEMGGNKYLLLQDNSNSDVEGERASTCTFSTTSLQFSKLTSHLKTHFCCLIKFDDIIYLDLANPSRLRIWSKLITVF